MLWSNERYVKVYTRETVPDVALTWEARAVWDRIMQRCDRAGVIDLGGCGARGLAGLLRIPCEVVEKNLPLLVDDGRVQLNGRYLVVPNFIEAQEASQSDKSRQETCRARRRDKALLITICDNASQNTNENSDTASQNVTESHAVSHGVTPSLDKPRQAIQDPAPARDGFDLFWDLYNIKTHKAEAIVIWKRLSLKDKDAIMSHLKQRIDIEERAKREGWFCANRPNPATFMRKKRWRDDLPQPPDDGKSSASVASRAKARYERQRKQDEANKGGSRRSEPEEIRSLLRSVPGYRHVTGDET